MKRREFSLPSGPMLTHFTKASPTGSAIDSLLEILRDGVVRGSSRMIRGNLPVVCFFDAKFEELKDRLTRRNRKRYTPFGVALDKRYAFRRGARPVIYLPWKEAEKLLPEQEYWRVVTMEMDEEPPVDWSFEREWRIKGDLPLPSGLVVALVESWHDADALFDHFNGRPPCAGVIPLREMFAGR